MNVVYDIDSFDADIICFQETKLTRETLDESLATVSGYDAFFSTCRSHAYSGVVTYCKTGTCPVYDALDGLSGALPAWFGPQVKQAFHLLCGCGCGITVSFFLFFFFEYNIT